MKFKLIYLICFICCVLLTFSTVSAVDLENNLTDDSASDLNQTASISQSESSKTNLNDAMNNLGIFSEDKDCVGSMNELSNLDSNLNSIDSDEYSLKSSLSSINSSDLSSDSSKENQKNSLKSSTLNAGTSTFSDLETLINNAREKSTINLDGKTYIGSGTPITINKAITINGGSNMATFDGRQMSAIFNIRSNNVHFINCRFIKGINRTVYFFGNNSSIVNCSFEDNYQHLRTGVGSENFLLQNSNFTNGNARSASTVMICSQKATVKDCNFINNTVSNDEELQGHGAALQIGESVGSINEGYVINCSFINNTVISNSEGTHAGALCFRPGIKVYDSIFINNYCNKVGGATTLHSDGEIINCTFINNRAGEYGGAISTGFDANDISVNITDCIFINNSAPMGGAIQIKGNNVKVTNSKFEENKASKSDGGAVFIVGNDALIINSTFKANSAKNVGAGLLINGSDVSVLNSSFNGNMADFGAGVYVVGSNANLFGSNFTNHNVKNGSVYIKGINTYIYDSNFMKNKGESGAGLFIEGSNTTLILTNFTDNNVTKNGGAVYIIGSNSKLISSQFLYNNAMPNPSDILSGLGGAVFIKGDNNTIDSSSFRYNTARNGSAIYTDGLNMVLSNDDFDRNQAWSYVLNSTVSPSLSYFNRSDILIDLTLVGGNNIANAIYNTASMDQIYFYNVSYISSKGQKITSSNEIHPVNGAENSKNGSLLYQDSREDNQLVNIIIFRDSSDSDYNLLNNRAISSNENSASSKDTISNRISSISSSDVIFNKTLNTGILGNISINLSQDNPIMPGKYILYAEHLEDDYYKEIDALNQFEILPLVDIAVDIVSSKDTVEYNKTNKFTIKVINYGPNNATDVKVNAIVPKGLILVSSNPSAGTYNASSGIWTIGKLESGENQTLAINTRAVSAGLINYPVNVSSYEKDTNESNNKDNVSVRVLECDLAIDVETSSNQANYGDIVDWTIEIENNGPNDASKVSISLSDLLSDDLIYISSNNSDFDIQNQKLEIAKLNNGDKVSIIVSTLINASNKKIGLNANVTTETFEYNLNNNKDNDYVNVAPLCDLEIDVIVSNESANTDEIVQWTIIVKNDGPDKAKDVNVLISDLDEIGLEIINSSDRNYNINSNEWIIGDLDNGDSRELVISTRVNTSDEEIFLNGIVDTSTYEPNKENNIDEDSLLVNPLCDLIIDIDVSQSPINKEDNVTWTITVTNDGPDDAHDVIVDLSDLESLGLIVLNVSDDDFNPDTYEWIIGDLDNNENATLTITTQANISDETINAEAIVNTSTFELDKDNNYDNEDLIVNPLCDLVLDITVSNHSANKDDVVDWTITVRNDGPDGAENLVAYLSDLESLGLDIINVSSDDFNLDTYEWVIGDLDNNENATLRISTKVNTNDAFIDIISIVDSDTFELNKDNNYDNDSLAVNPICDLVLDIAVSSPSANIGDIVDWTITVRNDGPDGAENLVATLSDLESLGLDIINVSSDDFNPESYQWIIGDLDNGDSVNLVISTKVNASNKTIDVDSLVDSQTFELDKDNNYDNDSLYVNPLCELSVEIKVSNDTINKDDIVNWSITINNDGPDHAQNVSLDLTDLEPLGLIIKDISNETFVDGDKWFVGDLAPGESVDLIITTQANVSNESLPIDAVVDSDTFELNKDNNLDSDILNINPLCDLLIDISVSNSSVNKGDIVEWTITVTNDGPNDASDVIVSLDNLRELGLIVLNVTLPATSEEDSANPSSSSENDSVNLLSSSEDDSANLLSANGDDSANLLSADDDESTNLLSSSEEDSLSGFEEDSLVESEENNSSENAFNNETNQWHIGDLAKNSQIVLKLATEVNKSNENITVPANVDTSTYELNKSNNYDEDQLETLPLCDLDISIVPDSETVYKDDLVNWIVTLTNRGPDNASDVNAYLNIPEGFEILGFDLDKGTLENDSDDSSIKLNWNIGDLAKNETIMLILSTKALKEGVAMANVSVNSSTLDSDESNNYDYAAVNVIPIDENPVLDNTTVNKSNKTNNANDKINNKHKSDDKKDNGVSSKKSKAIPMKKTGNPLVILVLTIFALFSLNYRKLNFKK